MRLSGIAPQFTATNGASRRALWSWIVRAISSLPVPDSPMINAVASVAATRSICEYSSIITGDEPYRSPYDFRPAISPALRFFCEGVSPEATAGESRSIDAMSLLSCKCYSGDSSGEDEVVTASRMAGPLTAARVGEASFDGHQPRHFGNRC